MHSICFFASYFKGEKLPYYLRYYLLELNKHFTEVVFISGNEKLDAESQSFFTENNIKLRMEKNEGFDFGLWYKALKDNDPLKYDRIAFVNDSSVLFKPLDDFFSWMNTEQANVFGMTESMAVSRHLQSYFLIFSKPVIPFVQQYFEKHGVKQTIQEVISDYEIGLSTFLLKNGFKLSAFVSNNGYSGEFSPYYYLLNDHLKQGVPLIKKKILFSSYRKSELSTLARMGFDVKVENNLEMIRSYNGSEKLIDFKKVLEDYPNEMASGDRFIYAIKRSFYKLFRPAYRLVKGK